MYAWLLIKRLRERQRCARAVQVRDISNVYIRFQNDLDKARVAAQMRMRSNP